MNVKILVLGFFFFPLMNKNSARKYNGNQMCWRNVGKF